MKKIFCILGVLICCVLCPLSVTADVIFEPDDSFYERHASQCTYVNRVFRANGPDGVVILYKSPESSRVIDTWENGFEVWISFVYEDEDGVAWGIYDRDKTGWMPMDYMELVYDSISFMEEYDEQITASQGSLDKEYLDKEVNFWKYPGSEEFYAEEIDSNFNYNAVYVDGAGHTWGYTGYYYGRRNIWVCIDNPAADYAELYPDGVPGGKPGENTENAQTPEQGDMGTQRIVPKVNRGMVLLAVGGVALVVLVTARLLLVMKKKS